jgi:hypothetical protein
MALVADLMAWTQCLLVLVKEMIDVVTTSKYSLKLSLGLTGAEDAMAPKMRCGYFKRTQAAKFPE